MESWFLDITSFYYYLKSIYEKETTFVFMGFSWGGYIAAAVASSLATTPSPVDIVLLVCPFSHYTDIGRFGRLFASRTSLLLDGLKIPEHKQIKQWHVLLFNSDATVNRESKSKWSKSIHITVIDDSQTYNKKTHNQILWSKEYRSWVLGAVGITALTL
jgi:pimeloyl-ACP methyl ester carboxylesterase